MILLKCSTVWLSALTVNTIREDSEVHEVERRLAPLDRQGQFGLGLTEAAPYTIWF